MLERQALLGFNIPINPSNDNITCRTIKAQYSNTSIANFMRKGTFGATGVLEVKFNA